MQQLQTDNWRIKCQIIDILKTFITTPTFLNESVLKALFCLTDDKIDAVRVKINELIILIINNNSKEWCDQNIIPKISQMKENANYIKKQNLLDIIEVLIFLFLENCSKCIIEIIGGGLPKYHHHLPLR